MSTPWEPTEEWKGQDAYIIGGGPSLYGFDWELLRGKNTIGCNAAFLLGSGIVKIVMFADIVWWDKIGKEGLEEYGGRVIAATPRAHKVCRDVSWVYTMKRNNVRRLGRKLLLYCGNVGSMAINLALILGASRVFLLGFDMQLGSRDGEPKANWHDLRHEPGKEDSYRRFRKEFVAVSRTLPLVFPGREIINVSDCSRLEGFPIVSLADHFN